MSYYKKPKKQFNGVYLIIISAISAEDRVDIVKLGGKCMYCQGARLMKCPQHILAALEHPEIISERCLAGEILGIESVHPRGITKETTFRKKTF